MLNTKMEAGCIDGHVAVRGLPYLAGSTSTDVPDSIPLADTSLHIMDGPWCASNAQEAANECRPLLDSQLYQEGSLLLRNLPLSSREDFGGFIQNLGYRPFSYQGGIAVRNHEPGFSLMASNEDARITMAPHNEMAYLPEYPRKLFFFCLRPGTTGGEVPISDIRESVRLIPEDVLNTFRDKGIRYYRHLPRETRDAEIGWVETFGTTDRGAVEGMMRAKGYDFAWHNDGSISYSYVNPAFVTHPDTGEELWFNQVTELHCSYWRNHPRFPSDLDDDQYPATTRYGDGTAIPPDLITFLRSVMWRTASAVRMRQGDVLALDNLVIQHGRIGFTGPRVHLVSITD